jgi:hypothetical protein
MSTLTMPDASARRGMDLLRILNCTTLGKSNSNTYACAELIYQRFRYSSAFVAILKSRSS